ncbi:hypothetical protein KPH14_012326 [Odynerus spinipes]|uniref:Uncharacterized protein n=1 Tax=Odynerus spinipes TaxID=1348599 RepID=A0AAD9VN80_9HYME|nr:hypothetical protein KPH14_012326 [Odynerus spinipes]
MPSRGAYQIAHQEERKATQRDQSYRICVATLLVFFMLCMIILISCIPWNKYSTSPYNKHMVHGEQLKPEVTIVETTVITTTDVADNKKEKTDQPFQSYHKDKTTMTLESLETNTLITTFDSINSLNNDANSTDSQDQSSTAVKKVQTTEQPELRYSDTSGTTLSDNYEISESTRQEETEEATYKNIDKYTDIETSKYSTISTDSKPVSNSSTFNQSTSKDDIYTTIEELNNTETTTPLTTLFSTTNSSELVIITDSTVDKNNSVTNNFTDEFSTIYEPPSTSKFTDFFTNATLTQTENTSTQETVIKIEFVTEENINDTTKVKATTESNIVTTTIAENDIKTCILGHCKQVAGKMLSYMNHSADPCEDFYEYSCGGMISDPQIIDLNLDSKAYRRIAKQMRDENNDAASLFANYYNSCMQYENTINIKERILLANQAINRIGKFYTRRDEAYNHGNFTSLYAALLLSYSPLLFDVAPDLDEYNPNLYTIRIGPVLQKNLLDSENINCHADEIETQKAFVDLESIYNSYTKCKENNTRFISSIIESLEVLGVFDDSDDIKQNVRITAFDIDNKIVDGFFSQFPSQYEIRQAYLMKNYSRVSLEQLNKTTTFINWYQLMFLLTTNNVLHDANMQVYFYDQLVKGLQHLENFWKEKPIDFHNAVLGLYAQKLYHELVISKHEDMKQHCLQVSINLLRPEASNLYMSSLSNKEIAHMKHMVGTFFDELKKTFKMQIQKRKWITVEQRQILLTKINDLALFVPEMLYFQNVKEKFYLSGNYMNNSLTLMKRYRSSIYSVIPLKMNPGTPEQIWTHYATPFQSKGIAIYGLNLVVIPFGAIDYGDVFVENNEALPNYLIWATIGNLIARQISHHFDVNGMHYWNQTRHIDYSLFSNNDFENLSFENYINCQKNNIYKDQMNMTLPLTSQTISFKISEHTLNERLSEIMGLRLTYDTLERLQLFSKDHLPWLELNIKQLFYLTYAQMYCTKSLLTTSYVSLHENEELPSRIRVFVAASGDNLLGELWNCPQGSQIVPSSTCDVFPYLELKDIEIDTA